MTTFARRFASFASLSVTATLLACLGVACDPAPASLSDSDMGGTERVELALTAIPAGTRCVRITAIGASRIFQEDFDVTSPTSLTASVGGLPAVTALTISADAFGVACTSITPTTQATWISAPVVVTIAQGTVPAIALVLRPAASVSGGVDFLFLAATPVSKTFPSVVVGQTSATAFSILNVGPAATGALTTSFTGAGGNQFAVTNGCAAGIAAAGTCTLQVAFAPTSAGAKTATLLLTGTPGGTLAIALAGTALQPAVLTLTPPAQDYGTVAVSRTSAPVGYIVTNTGGATTSAVVVTSSDPAFVISGAACPVLATGQTCSFNVQFAPTIIASKVATLTATAGTVVAMAMVTGNGVAAPALALSPPAIDFGKVVVTQPKQQPMTLTNVGGVPLGPFSFFLGGANPVDFTVAPVGCPPTLMPSQSCLINVTANPLSPAQPGAGTILVNATGANPASVMGTISDTTSWALTPNVTTFDFGSVKVGTVSSIVTFVFTNVGSVAIGPFVFSTSKPTIFAVGPNSCGNFGVAPGSTCSVTVQFKAPATAGPQLDALTVTGVPGGTPSVNLHGLAKP